MNKCQYLLQCLSVPDLPRWSEAVCERDSVVRHGGGVGLDGREAGRVGGGGGGGERGLDEGWEGGRGTWENKKGKSKETINLSSPN